MMPLRPCSWDQHYYGYFVQHMTFYCQVKNQALFRNLPQFYVFFSFISDPTLLSCTKQTITGLLSQNQQSFLGVTYCHLAHGGCFVTSWSRIPQRNNGSIEAEAL